MLIWILAAFGEELVYRGALSFVFVLVMFAICGMPVWANPVDLQLVSVGSNNAGGVATYPYYFSVNGATPVAMICDSYDNHVFIGESWQANLSGLLSGQLWQDLNSKGGNSPKNFARF